MSRPALVRRIPLEARLARGFGMVFGLLAAFVLPMTARAQGVTHLIVIAGLGGEPQYSKQFTEWGGTLVDAAKAAGVPAADIAFLAETDSADPRVTGKSDSAGIAGAFRAVDGRAAAEDVVIVVLIGHGSYRGGESRLSLPGPDLTAADFERLVDGLGKRRVALVNTASASGEFIARMAGPERVVITATKSGMERNEAQFGGFFAEAFAGNKADTDKDGRVSLLEAFTYARLEVERAYKTDNRLLTEHAQLDDDGDGKGTAEPGGENGDGALARTLTLSGGVAAAVARAPAGASEQVRALYQAKAELEKQIEALKSRKAAMPEAAYRDSLEALLVDLALKSQAIRKLEGK